MNRGALKNSIIFYFFFFEITQLVLCQDIPPDCLVNWAVAGLESGFALPETQVNALDFGAVGNGEINDAPAIQSAINSFGGHPGMVILPAGTYLMNNPVSMADSVILAGSGSDSSLLIFDLGGLATNCFSFSKGQIFAFQPLLAGFNEGSFSLILNSEHGFHAGDYAEIRQANGSWDTNPASWALFSIGQMVIITQVTGDTILIQNPLRHSYEISLNPEIRKIIPRRHAGIQCLKISRVDEPSEGAGSNFDLAYAANCRIAGVESDHSVGAHINMHCCTNIEVSGCFFHDAFTYDGAGTRGYGVCLSMHSGECLITNNIFKHLRHAMMVKTGSNGNVFSYNYSIEPYRSEPISDFSGDISLHGHYAYANLFEGNICQNIIIDHYWGPSGSYNTFFRNRAEWFGIIMTADNGVSTDKQNFIGNELTQNGYNWLIQLYFGLYYVLTGNDHFQFGNNSDGEIIPSGTEALTKNSLYLNYAPKFWDESAPWPSIGYPNELNSGLIPAKTRYNSGSVKTLCPEFICFQKISVRAGWSGISSFAEPYPCAIDFLMQPVMERIEIIYNDDGIFFPVQNINTLETWNWQSGYIIKMNQEAEIEFSGADCRGEHIFIKEGWNIFPVLSQSEILTDSLAAKYPGKISVIKEISGCMAFWPIQNIFTLRQLRPGKAYFLKAESPFIYQNNEK
ncbi:MAG: glycoside hydrolase family 55 protein [Bacteroidales bacterium]|nr:glycoside hydrolase family 55 protein [Bacteroidales bacterium]